MSPATPKKLYLPARDRSFWKCPEGRELPLQYLAWGHRDFKKEPIPSSLHEGWTCLLVEEGVPTLTIDGKTSRVTAGTLAILGPDCPFGWEAPGNDQCKFIVWMWRDLDGLPRERGAASHIIRILSRKMQEPLFRLHEACRDEVLRLDDLSDAFLEGCYLQFLATLQRTLTAEPDKDSTHLLKQVVTWMEQHLDSSEPVARLCDYLNLSQSTLYRLFRDEHGVSPLTYFNQLKMEHARRLLRAGGRTVKEVAHELGYRYFNDFSRAYKNFHGRTPVEDRDG